MRRFATATAWNLGLPIILLLTLAYVTQVTGSVFFPPLSEVLGALPRTWDSQRIVDDVLPSLARLLAGLGIGVVVSVIVGTVLGMSLRLYYMTDHVIAFFRAIPAPAMLPILLIVFGIGDFSKIAMIAVGTTWPMLINTIDGVRSVPVAQRQTMAVLRLPLHQRWWLSFVHASPQFFAGARQAIALSIILMVVSEMYMSSNGIGYSIIQFQRQFAITNLWTGIIVLGVLGVAASWIGERIERASTRWHVGMTGEQEWTR